MELLVIELVNQAKELYYSQDCVNRTIKETVKMTLEQRFKENKISSTEYRRALDILEKYHITTNQVGTE